MSLRDDRGATVQMHQAPQRVVTLLPSLTEAVCVLGACDRLVGVDRWSNWPANIEKLPRVGGLDDANVEAIVALRPDLVLASPSSRLAQRLRGLGLQVAEFEAQTLNDVPRILKHVAALLGRPQAADPVWQDIERQLRQAQSQVPQAVKGTRVYFEVATAPYAAGEVSFIGQLWSLLGGRNIVPAALGPFPKLNPEFVVRADPDLIILPEHDAAALRRRPGWAGMTALQRGRVCALKPPDYDLLARPGPRMGQAAGVLLHCLQRQAQTLQKGLL
ncbi:MAG: ABC transporter substrate-binding protein [Acidobacteriota bacterium]